MAQWVASRLSVCWIKVDPGSIPVDGREDLSKHPVDHFSAFEVDPGSIPVDGREDFSEHPVDHISAFDSDGPLAQGYFVWTEQSGEVCRGNDKLVQVRLHNQLCTTIASEFVRNYPASQIKWLLASCLLYSSWLVKCSSAVLCKFDQVKQAAKLPWVANHFFGSLLLTKYS